jgi:hypothetical protein
MLIVPSRRPNAARKPDLIIDSGVARYEFGRFYWNWKLARQQAQAMAAGPSRRAPESKMRPRLSPDGGIEMLRPAGHST